MNASPSKVIALSLAGVVAGVVVARFVIPVGPWSLAAGPEPAFSQTPTAPAVPARTEPPVERSDASRPANRDLSTKGVARKAKAPSSASSTAGVERKSPEKQTVRSRSCSSKKFPLANRKPIDPSQPAPKLVVPNPKFDFGRRERGQIVEHTFILRNEGSRLLQVEQVNDHQQSWWHEEGP